MLEFSPHITSLVALTKEYLKKASPKLKPEYREVPKGDGMFLVKKEPCVYICIHNGGLEISGRIEFYKNEAFFQMEKDQIEIIRHRVNYDNLFDTKIRYYVNVVEQYAEIIDNINSMFEKNKAPRKFKIDNILADMDQK